MRVRWEKSFTNECSAGDADAEDVLLLEDLLGIAEPEAALAKVDPDARRRR